jgi:hydroxyethylthiazole kinase
MSPESLARRAASALGRLRDARPLVHHITNLVVMNDTANVTLLLGASPVMAHASEEVEEMVSMAGALVLNPGTLDPAWVEAMLRAGLRARALPIPVVLDPVGAGATAFRTRTNRMLLERVRPSIVRGNPGEIGALSGAGGSVRGVDSVADLPDAVEAARRAARAWGAVVAVTGARDLVTDGERCHAVDNGHVWLTTLTGTGCMATTAVAAFAAVEPDGLVAAVAGLAAYGLAAERAAARSPGPGSFKVALFDELHGLTPAILGEGARISDPL